MKSADWDRLARDFEAETCDITREESADTVARFVAAVPLPAKPVLVDLGCGIGSFIARFGMRFHAIYGVEFAPRIIARARARCGDEVNWLASDIPWAAKTIGRVAHLTVCMNVITQATAAARGRLWRSLADVTKMRGHALVVVPSLESEEMVVALSRQEPEWRKGGLVRRDGVWQKHFRREELADVLASHGFRVTRIAKAHYPWSIEGLRETKGRRANRPWDWIALARKT
ncbi:MAG: methyltransferase domain-containing protein [Alphaproteobacteria bacterium]|nr:methyltransferase domain-containing protein [Alphaproteobacteria bacterium]MBV9693954.1 methyltransferase domain-containing protein [Alphaproteobacteria bacterium]